MKLTGLFPLVNRLDYISKHEIVYDLTDIWYDNLQTTWVTLDSNSEKVQKVSKKLQKFTIILSELKKCSLNLICLYL